MLLNNPVLSSQCRSFISAICYQILLLGAEVEKGGIDKADYFRLTQLMAVKFLDRKKLTKLGSG